MDWFGKAHITFTHSSSPIGLRSKNGSHTDLGAVCKQSTPACYLNPFLFNGHLQTMWTAAVKHGPPIHYRRKIFNANHKTYHGTFAVDFVVPPHVDTDAALPPRTALFAEGDFEKIGSDDKKPMLIILHGLSGGSHEIYLRHCIQPLIDNGGEWEVCVVNSRGCAETAVTSGVLFNARATWDVRQIVDWARETFPNRPLFGLGFSLGANILTNYLGEEGLNCPLKAAVVVGNPFDLQIANKVLQGSILGKQVYQRVMGTNMRNLITRHRDSITRFTDLDFSRIEKVTYLYEFDREVQCQTWGYPTEEAYYRDASSSDSVLAIRIPLLAIQAADDPIAVKEATPSEEFKQNPYTVLCTTSLGGHLSWFELGGGRWHAKPVANFLNRMAFDIDIELGSKPGDMNGTANEAEQHHGAVFNPMRRKLTINGS